MKSHVDESKDNKSHVPTSKPFHKSFVTVWRAHMMLMTVISILAVDFPAFPRSFGKTESWGTSLVRSVGVLMGNLAVKLTWVSRWISEWDLSYLRLALPLHLHF